MVNYYDKIALNLMTITSLTFWSAYPPSHTRCTNAWSRGI